MSLRYKACLIRLQHAPFSAPSRSAEVCPYELHLMAIIAMLDRTAPMR